MTAQLWYTVQHRTVLIMFDFIIQMLIIAYMLSVGEEITDNFGCMQWFLTW